MGKATDLAFAPTGAQISWVVVNEKSMGLLPRN